MNERQFRAEMKLFSLHSIVRAALYTALFAAIVACFTPTVVTAISDFHQMAAVLR